MEGTVKSALWARECLGDVSLRGRNADLHKPRRNNQFPPAPWAGRMGERFLSAYILKLVALADGARKNLIPAQASVSVSPDRLYYSQAFLATNRGSVFLSEFPTLCHGKWRYRTIFHTEVNFGALQFGRACPHRKKSHGPVDRGSATRLLPWPLTNSRGGGGSAQTF